ncbi:MAG: bifunctional folylpolyglutamate synthase/dihydrofolate synthase, partial [Firmicutes bacterium]|nr:bifunctional folylpolyglutamate synthase/dihydrofolate synthase [Bacillota bacterium]
GENIPDEALIKYCEKIAPTLELIDMTIAEREYISPIAAQVLIALLHFYGKTDLNIFECGKGVLYDDVNNLSRSYSVINKIFLEHTRELGDTIEKIAFDKAHIIVKGQKCAYTAAQSPEVMEILQKRADDCGVKLKKYGSEFYCENIDISENGTSFDVITKTDKYENINISLLGAHQAENFALALALCEDILKDTGIDKEKVKTAAKNIVWRGRLEIISKDPLVIADCCINRESAVTAKQVLKNLKKTSLAAVIAVPADKDCKGVAKEISEIADKIIFTKVQNPHYKFEKTQSGCIKGAVFAEDIKTAVNLAKQSADTVCILGTTAMLAEVYALMG